jgi:hypothetical protein
MLIFTLVLLLNSGKEKHLLIRVSGKSHIPENLLYDTGMKKLTIQTVFPATGLGQICTGQMNLISYICRNPDCI